MRAWPGSPSPLGATWDGSGANFALFSQHATKVELCLFDAPGDTRERIRVPLVDRTNLVWHVYLPDVRPGQLYGYRVSGPWKPLEGHRFNPAKVVLDPYAREIGRPVTWSPSLLAYQGKSEGPASRADSAPYAPLGTVTDETYEWGHDHAPRTPWHRTVIYEAHVKGLTALNPHIPPDLRGTYLGLASPPAIRHLTDLGVTAVELLPVQEHADEWRLMRTGLVNYWGYNTLAFFAADHRFASGRSPSRARSEFRTMIRALHKAGLEVILDVVYNHTAESDHLGPTLSFRGIDNRTYYRLEPAKPARYQDFTGTGNTLNLPSPVVLTLVMDSLRYWVEQMHVDGFRFDLASALTRDHHGVTLMSPFLTAVRQDPVLAKVKLIAEPWDIAPDGYRVGNFPPGWMEWNGRYRDTIRRFWRGDAGMLPDLATRLSGSSDLYGWSGRQPTASVNFVTSHDGFTVADLVSYADRHNEANGEENRDGESNNFSTNFGVEGVTSNVAILTLRARQQRNFLTTLLVSIGVPMLSGGDEVGRTQNGNNNAYCHDSALSWTPWDLDTVQADVLTFVQRLTTLRASQPVLQRRAFLRGTDVLWLRPDGQVMTAVDWNNPEQRTLGMLLDGRSMIERNAHGMPIAGDTLLVLLHAGEEDIPFVLPERQTASWTCLVDTSGGGGTTAAGPIWLLKSRSAAIFQWRTHRPA